MANPHQPVNRRVVHHRSRPAPTIPDLSLVIAATTNVPYAKGVAPFGAKVADAFTGTRGLPFASVANMGSLCPRRVLPRPGLGRPTRIRSRSAE